LVQLRTSPKTPKPHPYSERVFIVNKGIRKYKPIKMKVSRIQILRRENKFPLIKIII
jgi:hypothetical protein